MSNFAHNLAQTQTLIQPILDKALALTDYAPPLLEAGKHGLKEGKRFRAHLVRVTADILKVDCQQSLHVGAAIEMVHAYSLIHDDLPLMDNADMRRGHLTVHKKFDEATALLAGNALLTEAFHLLASDACHTNPSIKIQLIRELTQAIGFQGMMAGQMLDMQACHKTIQDLKTMEALKTGSLLTYAMKAPLIMAGCDVTCHPFIGLAQAFGLAFQIVDDILDVTAPRAVLGKPTNHDKYKDKITFVTLMGVENSKKYAKECVCDALSLLPASLNPHAVWNTIGDFILNRQS